MYIDDIEIYQIILRRDYMTKSTKNTKVDHLNKIVKILNGKMDPMTKSVMKEYRWKKNSLHFSALLKGNRIYTYVYLFENEIDVRFYDGKNRKIKVYEHKVKFGNLKKDIVLVKKIVDENINKFTETLTDRTEVSA
jgi:hypothetical protein